MTTIQNAKRTPTRSQSSRLSNYLAADAGEPDRPLRRPGRSAYVAQRIGYRALALA
jgi:hypothetical protein